MALEQTARIAEFTHDRKRAATLYGQAFEHMQRQTDYGAICQITGAFEEEFCRW
jgi:hypothetical protein